MAASRTRSKTYPYVVFPQQNSFINLPSTNSYSENSRSEQSSVEISDLNEVQSLDLVSTSEVLTYCKKFFIVPYIRLLAALGWRPLLNAQERRIYKCINWSYAAVIIVLTLFSYVLQAGLNFRRDRASYFAFQRNCSGDHNLSYDSYALFQYCCYYFFSSILHFTAYAYTFYILRITECEQMQILIEKVFLQTSHSTVTFLAQLKLKNIIWCFLFGAVLWLFVSIIGQGLLVKSNFSARPSCDIAFIHLHSNDSLKVAAFVCMGVLNTWHDLIHVIILWSYGMQCQLLIMFLESLCERLRGRIQLQEAIKVIDESYKLLNYLNKDVATCVSVLLLYSGSLLTLGIKGLLNERCKDSFALVATVFAIVMWIIAFFFPIVQAARLTTSCNNIRFIGHHIRTRPFGYQEVDQQDLDSFLLYVTTLKMKAKLFGVPIQSGFLSACLAVFVFIFILCST